jgi:hypothetical protein
VTRRTGENEYLVSASGLIYPLGDTGAKVTGLDEIPVTYQTTRAYKQHSVTTREWHLTPRTLSFEFGVDRRDIAAYRAARDALIGILKPNTGMVTYTRVYKDATKRAIDGWLSAGPGMNSESPNSFDADFSLRCDDPTFYSPDEQSATLSSSSMDGFSIPDWIGEVVGEGTHYFSDALEMAATVVNGGTWRAYPTITVAGPYQSCRISNLTTGAELLLGVAVSSDRTLSIDLAPGALSIMDDLGVNRMDNVYGGTLIDWYLEAGANSVVASGVGFVAGETTVSLAWHERYIAI